MDVFCIHVCFGLLCVPTIAIKQEPEKSIRPEPNCRVDSLAAHHVGLTISEQGPGVLR